MPDFRKRYDFWLNSGVLTGSELDELKNLTDNEVESRFTGMLDFGTAGLRGVMGAGSARMNIHTVRHATQALCELILEEEHGDKCVAVCYDPRINSLEFARAAAEVIAGNGIHVRIFDDIRPTPLLSFAIREYKCTAGINITASHNTKEYSGYKVYRADGAQLPPEQSARIAEKMTRLDVFASIKRMEYGTAVKAGLVTVMGNETDELFLQNVMAQANGTEAVSAVSGTFKLVYTPFHGTGAKLVPEAFTRLGLKNVICVPEQMAPDGTFPTVESPNPENPEGFALAVSLAQKHDASLIIGTDPDADRVGIMSRKGGGYAPLTGNQTGVLLLDYLIGAKTRSGVMPKAPVALKTIVTTDMARRVAVENGVSCYDTFTGFKFMAEKKNALEAAGEGRVIFAYEESYGYMIGDFVRDKDAVTASMLIAEMAAWYYSKGMTLHGAMDSLYEKYGCYGEKTVNIMMPGLEGNAEMKALMERLRAKPPEHVCGVAVTSMRDYLSGSERFFEDDRNEEMELCGSNVLRLCLGDGSAIIVRPSGTEPKVKVYVLVSGDSTARCGEKINEYADWAAGFFAG